MADKYRLFGPYILLKEVFTDDLGHLYRAGLVDGETIAKPVWLRLLDGPDVQARITEDTIAGAAEIGERLTGSQLPQHPFFLIEDGTAAVGGDLEPGQPLNRVLAQARDEAFPFQPDNSLLIIEKIAMALTAAEAFQLDGSPLAHGFLHPGLVHLSNDGEATVFGFGIGNALAAALGRPGSLPGARAYLAPEVLDGSPADGRADVYSLGAILFHLLAGTALPAATEERGAALEAAHLAWDGEPFPGDISAILQRALAPARGTGFESATAFRTEVEDLLYGGAYSPTTFNVALAMDRLFREEIDRDTIDMQEEAGLDPSPFLPVETADDEPEPHDAAVVTPAPLIAATSPEEPEGTRLWLWLAVAAVAVIAAGAVFWFVRGTGDPQPAPPPTPTADEIAAQRQAQEERLRSLTQEMVQEMMAAREQEIREELIARQSRIEELQLRLQQSERRAATSAAAAASEAETQRALMDEIQQQEEAQRAQQEALETERRQTQEEAAGAAGDTATAQAGAESAPEDVEVATGATPEPIPTAAPSPTPAELEIFPRPMAPAITVGAFFPPEEVDTRPVVIKSQPLEWPRSAARSRGRGVVVVQLTVNATGGVGDVEILRADHSEWGIPEAALEAAAGYRFKPGTKDGVAITTHAFVTWRYDFTEE